MDFQLVKAKVRKIAVHLYFFLQFYFTLLHTLHIYLHTVLNKQPLTVVSNRKYTISTI